MRNFMRTSSAPGACPRGYNDPYAYSPRRTLDAARVIENLVRVFDLGMRGGDLELEGDLVEDAEERTSSVPAERGGPKRRNKGADQRW